MCCRRFTAAGILLAAVLPLPAAAAIERVAGPGRGDGCPPLAAFVEPTGCTVGAGGVVYLADGNGNEIRRIAGGVIERVAGTGQVGAPYDGDGGPAAAARLNYPGDVAVGADGTIYFTDTSNHLIKAISPGGTLRTLAGGWFNNPFAYPFGLVIGPDGALYVADSAQNRVIRFALPCESNCVFTVVAGTGGWGLSGDGGPATAATMRTPRDVAFDAAGNLLIADSDNHRIRKVSPAGIISTVAGSPGGPFGGDGGPATAAKLSQPFSIAVGGADLFIADTNNNRVRKVDAAGIISTVAGTGLSNPKRDFTADPLALAITLPKAVCAGALGLLVGTEADRTLYRLPLDQVPPTVTRVATATSTRSLSATATLRPSATLTPPSTATWTATATLPPSSTATATTTRTGTPSVTARATATDTPTQTASATVTALDTPTQTPPKTITLAQATETPAPPILICDVTGNGMVSTIDATRILQAVAGTVALDARQTVAADATGNGTISAVDATRVLQFVAGLRPPTVPASRCGERVSG